MSTMWTAGMVRSETLRQPISQERAHETPAVHDRFAVGLAGGTPGDPPTDPGRWPDGPEPPCDDEARADLDEWLGPPSLSDADLDDLNNDDEVCPYCGEVHDDDASLEQCEDEWLDDLEGDDEP